MSAPEVLLSYTGSYNAEKYPEVKSDAVLAAAVEALVARMQRLLNSPRHKISTLNCTCLENHNGKTYKIALTRVA